MNASASTNPGDSREPPGWYGKLSMLGDFAQRRLPEHAVQRCDTWLSQAMAASREQLGAGWLADLPQRAGAALCLGAGCARRALVVRRADAQLRPGRTLLPAVGGAAPRTRPDGPYRTRPSRTLVRAPHTGSLADLAGTRSTRQLRGRIAQRPTLADAGQREAAGAAPGPRGQALQHRTDHQPARGHASTGHPRLDGSSARRIAVVALWPRTLPSRR